MVTATPTTDIVFDNLSQFDGIMWLYSKGVCWDYATFKSYPDVVRINAVRFIKTGWNSDTGSVSYRQKLPSDAVATREG